MTVVGQAKQYDVCIIGSGAGGGMAAHALTKAGADVIVLEAGVPWDNARDSAMLTWPYESPRRGRSTKERRVPPAAHAALSRAAGQAGGGQAPRHLHSRAALDPHTALERPGRMSLLRSMQPRLPRERELHLHQRADRPGARHR